MEVEDSQTNPEEQEIEDIPVENLYLDENNPRLAWRVASDTISQEDLLEVLWQEMAVEELVTSIAENGYFRSEPLFVIPRDEEGYTVVEGNRRLTAVLILIDSGVREDLNIHGLPYELTEDDEERLRDLPCIIFEDRHSLWTTVGYRHINGIKSWDSFSKAEYIARVHEEYGIDLDDLARRIGDTHRTVRRMYVGYNVLRQAEESGIYDRDNTTSKLHFSHLYTALDQTAYQEFLGVEREDLQNDHPIDDQHLDCLEEILSWLYGNETEGVDRVIKKQSPDVSRLGDVIQDDEALETLRETRDLQEAHETSEGESTLFRRNVFRAKRALKEAISNLSAGYSGNGEEIEVMEDVIELANDIYELMKSKD